jgi:SAM-dependent methyltransferase
LRQDSIRVLELGAGLNPRFIENGEVIHLDKFKLPDIEIVLDLNRLSSLFGSMKLPFKDSCFNEVWAYDILEHIIDVIPVIDEIHRVLKPGGLLKIHTSNYKFPNAFRDPSHYHFFTLESFDYWDPTTPIGQKYGFYSSNRFKIIERKLDGQELYFCLRKL